ncbi:MAG: acyl-CoA dehydrogenase family protein [Acidimicrobiales bacterium]
MDFELSDDQRALQDAARELLDREASPERVRAAMASGGGWDPKLWRSIVDQGWMGVEVPESDGGLGLGMVEAAVLLEEVGRHVAPAPFLPSFLALGALHRATSRGVGEAARFLEPLVLGQSVGCVAWAPSTTVELGAGGRLTGRTGPVIAGPQSDVAVVVARDGDLGEGLYVVDLVETGPPDPEPAMDQTQLLGWLELDGAPALRLGGIEAVDDLVDRGAAGHAAQLLGGGARALEMASGYAKERVQFGRPIGSFQAVKHRCADMVVDVEGMRSLAYYAAWAIGAGEADSAIAASSAKVWCSDAAKRVMASSLQVHGGIGFTWEHDLHLFLKRSQLDQVSFGDASYHRQRLARLLRPRVEAGESLF